jgi:uncharacterized cofD-like protein
VSRNIVTIGAGTGQSTLLRGLRDSDWTVTAVVGVTDNGGHSGSLRDSLGIPQVGDYRNCLEAVLPEHAVWTHLFQHRFRDGDLSGIHLGNLMVAALVLQEGSLPAAADFLYRELDLPVRVMPAAGDSIHIGAILEDGQSVVGEWEIIRREPRVPIRDLFLEPTADARPEVLTAIGNADAIVICPGSLRTGIIPTLLLNGMKEAIVSSDAALVYVCNIMTQPGQTDEWSVADHVAEIKRYAGRAPDHVLVHEGEIPSAWTDAYAAEGSTPVMLEDGNGATIHRENFLLNGRQEATRPGPFVSGLHAVRHDPSRVLASISRILE